MPHKPVTSLPRVVMVTNIPAPYRNPVYQRLAKLLGHDNFHVVFCAGREDNREWIIEQQGFAHTFLPPFNLNWKGRYIHINLAVLPVLRKLAPDVVITTGFNPTHLLAFTYAILNRKVHIPMTDGTLSSERILSGVHRLVRRIVFKHSKAFIGASNGSAKLYANYGIKPEQFFQSHLCANNQAFVPQPSKTRRFDFMFCGRFSPEKNPVFALDVAAGVAKVLGRKVSVLLVGSGPLLEQVRAYAAMLDQELDIVFSGFVQQAVLPGLYCSAKIFLFPTSWDPWGVVANEACAAGQAIIVSPLAGVAGEIVIDDENGFILPLSLDLWIEQAAQLLNNQQQLDKFSAFSHSHVQNYNYDAAAQGVVAAAVYSMLKPGNPSRRQVVIVQRRLTDYRVPLFEGLRKQLQKEGVQLRLLYSDASVAEQSKQDEGSLVWAEKIPAHYFLDNKVCWQPYFAQVQDADLVIVTQENKLICNLWPLFVSRPYRLAFWGHGLNRQATNPNSVLEDIKSLSTTRVDWWFSYTASGKNVIARRGFSADKITNLENSIDTTVLQAQCASIEPPELEALRAKLKLGTGPIGLYVGSLYPDKRLDFLLEAAALLAQRLPGFHLIIIGDGPLRNMVEDAANYHAWLRYVGRQTDRDKARFLKLADVILNPGLVGLGILDAFVAGIPLITTYCNIHSPEIDYLRPGENGFMTANTIKAYVAQVEQVLTDTALATHLHEGCKKAAGQYTIENMTANFVTGILQALGR